MHHNRDSVLFSEIRWWATVREIVLLAISVIWNWIPFAGTFPQSIYRSQICFTLLMKVLSLGYLLACQTGSAHIFCRNYISTVQLPIQVWWRHQMETFPMLLVLCAGNLPATGEFPWQRPVTRSFDVFFDRHLNRQLINSSRRRWFEMPSYSLWRHCYAHIHYRK